MHNRAMATHFAPVPSSLLPRYGNFGSGPSRLFPGTREAIEQSGILGTSHRREPVKNCVQAIQEMLLHFFHAPQGYEVILGNGGASLVWDALAWSGLEGTIAAATHGEFSAKAARAAAKSPWVERVKVYEAPAGSCAFIPDDEQAQAYVYAHNETSTGVMGPLKRYGKNIHEAQRPLTFVDATSIACGIDADLNECDMYYFSPQKCLASDGGLWLAIISPHAARHIERCGKARARKIPDMLNMSIALENSRKAQTLNTPAIATLVMIRHSLETLLSRGGVEAIDRESREKSAAIYAWAEEKSWACPFVSNPSWRSPVVATIDLDDSIPVADLLAHLRHYGICDIEAYRSLGRNQIRIGAFPAVSKEDIEALLASITYAVENA